MSNKIEKIVFDFLASIINELGYELADVEYRTINGEKNITVIICGNEAITLDDCEKVHNAIDAPLDELNPTSDEPYTLNVSSFGLDRAFKSQRDFERNYGENVEVRFFEKVNGKKMIVGKLLEFNDGKIKLLIDNKEISFDMIAVSKVSKEVRF